jgi:hypothetical protein
MMLDAVPDRARLEQLPAGVRHTLDLLPRLPDGMPAERVTIDPPLVRMSFTIRSRTRDLRLEGVPVHIAGPHSDHGEFRIDLLDTWLDPVIITADADLIQRIERDEMVVVAFVHLTNGDKQRRIDRKQVAYFMAMEKPDWSRGQFVNGRLIGAEEAPVIRLAITRVPAPSPAGEN